MQFDGFNAKLAKGLAVSGSPVSVIVLGTGIFAQGVPGFVSYLACYNDGRPAKPLIA